MKKLIFELLSLYELYLEAILFDDATRGNKILKDKKNPQNTVKIEFEKNCLPTEIEVSLKSFPETADLSIFHKLTEDLKNELKNQPDIDFKNFGGIDYWYSWEAEDIKLYLKDEFTGFEARIVVKS